MPRFFVSKEQINGNIIEVVGEDARHISKSLRMKIEEEVTVCDGCGTDYFCKIRDISDTSVLCDIIHSEKSKTEPSVKVTLYQGLPKSDKLELIVQKCTELGIYKIVPVLMYRSVSRPDEKKGDKKAARWQKIAEEAAKQSQRGIIPEVTQIISFDEMAKCIKQHQKVIVFYESSDEPFSQLLKDDFKDMAIVIGPEGGFEPQEIQVLSDAGANIATLGKRILRTETAGMAALSAIMFATGNMD